MQVGNQAQAGNVLDGLMRRAILAQADRVVGIDQNIARAHERRHAYGVARVVRKRQERRAERREPAVQAQPVRDRGHREFAYAVIDVVAAVVAGPHRHVALEVGAVRAGQVRGAADQFRQFAGVGLDRRLRRLARGRTLAFGLHLLDEGAALRRPVARHVAGHAALELGGILRVLRRIGRPRVLPLFFGRRAFLALVPRGVDVVGNGEAGLIGPADLLTRGGDFVVAQGRAVHTRSALLVGRTPADHRLAADKSRSAGLLLGGVDRGLDLFRVVTVDVANHLPAIGLEAARRIVGEPVAHLAVDGDAVVIIEDNQLAQTERTGQRAGFVGDPFHETAVADETPGVVIDQRGVVVIEAIGERRFRQRHANGIRKALAERAGRGLDPRGHEILGVARRLRMQLTKRLDVVERQIIAGQMKRRVLQHGTVPVRQDEAVAVHPVRVGRVHLQVIIEEHLGDIGHTHGHAGMTRIGLLDGVHRQNPDGVGEITTGWHR